MMATTVTLTLWGVTSPASAALMHPAPPPPPFRPVDTTTGVTALADALCDPPDMTPTLVVTAVNRTREIPLDPAHIADEKLPQLKH